MLQVSIRRYPFSGSPCSLFSGDCSFPADSALPAIARVYRVYPAYHLQSHRVMCTALRLRSSAVAAADAPGPAGSKFCKQVRTNLLARNLKVGVSLSKPFNLKAARDAFEYALCNGLDLGMSLNDTKLEHYMTSSPSALAASDSESEVEQGKSSLRQRCPTGIC